MWRQGITDADVDLSERQRRSFSYSSAPLSLSSHLQSAPVAVSTLRLIHCLRWGHWQLSVQFCNQSPAQG